MKKEGVAEYYRHGDRETGAKAKVALVEMED